MSDNEKLMMTFDPRTIEHLGVKMYSTLPPAIAELIANGYDACAKNVTVKLSDNPKKIEVIDNGTGMTFEEINTNFLRIGRNRRVEEQAPPCKRLPTGKKGLGKLALFGIGKVVEIITKKDGKEINFLMDWDNIMNAEGDYEPAFKINDCSIDDIGTTIIVHELKRKTNFNRDDMAHSISKLFNFNDANFEINIILNNGKPLVVDRDLKFKNIDKQFEWKFPKLFELTEAEYKNKDLINGVMFTSEKPLQPGLRGITLYANGRMVNLPEFFGRTESSHFFSYLSGYLDVDFIDTWEEDVISTDRQSLDWENVNLQEMQIFLQEFLKALEKDWREKRSEVKRAKTREVIGIDTVDWFNKTSENTRKYLSVIVDAVLDESELSTAKQTEVVDAVHALVPEYPEYHWRHLHNSIKRVSKEDYEKADYLRAAKEAAVEYENIVKRISGITDKMGVDLMRRSFGSDCSAKPINITECTTDTQKNIEDGQQNMSVGVVAGFRNPTSHEPKTDLYPHVFNDNDCLDILSIVSYLLTKLDQRKKPPIS
ncbi:TIGR02391 family protein [Sulfurimonas sp.]|uniref:TIGR02391 family protein n=1 Tax=Sulfurimonas sp. TaxID=2022749 RepID=UPI0019FA466B|nr:TIGR02391 family protein [Sulfurimonas sp.]MBE0515555.1 TIGR02391 family protein [Sulfurimonas sp.]